MKRLGYIILAIVLLAITGLIVYIIATKQKINTDEFNIKRGDVLTFEKYNTEVKILNVASTLCKEENCNLSGEIEISVEVTYDDMMSTYTLKSVSKNSERIKNSNNYIFLYYENDKIRIEIKDKNEI